MILPDSTALSRRNRTSGWHDDRMCHRKAPALSCIIEVPCKAVHLVALVRRLVVVVTRLLGRFLRLQQLAVFRVVLFEEIKCHGCGCLSNNIRSSSSFAKPFTKNWLSPSKKPCQDTST